MSEGSTRLEGPDPPAPAGRILERPAWLEDGEFVEAVSHAVLRELEGGSFPLPGVFLGLIFKLITS
jgi:hypothetical protein